MHKLLLQVLVIPSINIHIIWLYQNVYALRILDLLITQIDHDFHRLQWWLNNFKLYKQNYLYTGFLTSIY